jgi:hypothetical protein
MAKLNFSAKHVAINKANTQIVAVVGLASFIVVFCLVASKAVFSQYEYQSRVIKAATAADDQLKANISTYSNLVQSYDKFDTKNPITLANTVPGSTNDNVQIILDALPAAYDFPGLTSTVENVLVQTGQQVSAFSGTDEQGTTSNSSATPQPIAMPFGFSVANGNYGSVQQLIQVLQQSIRPMPMDTLNITAQQATGSQPAGLTMTVTAHSYYQPAKTLSITKETVN